MGASLLRLEIDVPDAVAASATRGERAPLPWPQPLAITLRPFADGDADHAWVVDAIGRSWGWPVVSPNGVWDAAAGAAQGLVAVDADTGERVGLVTWRDDAAGREIVALEAFIEHRGVGRALMDAAAQDAPARIWLATTDTNIRAIDFYQRWGMDLVELRRHFVEEVRHHKPSVTGFRSRPQSSIGPPAW